MAWPGITDFSEAVQNPHVCFRGTELESGLLAVNQRGMPLVFSGAFACVYSVEAAGRKFAVRCFTREVSDQQSRYNQLSEYLINVLPPSFVDFEYLEQGINLKGDWYPIVRMEWVEGESLSSFVNANLHDPDTLLRVAAQWRGGPCASLRGLRIAHNDLQHGNVMVQADGRIRLVDYDGMFLPQFRGERSPELGHKNYQHPQRTADDYDAYVDNFPSVVVYLSLLALADDPGLWSYFNDDNLIFTRDDYGDPANSELFSRLKRSSDETVAKLAESLEECCAMPVADVPDLETLLQAIPQRTAPLVSAPARPAATTQPAPPPPASWGVAAPAQPMPATVACAVCGRDNRPQAARCAYCGATMITAAAAQPATPQPTPPTPAAAQPVASPPQPAQPAAAPTFARPAPVVHFPAPQGQFKKVALGVSVTVLAVTAGVVLAMAWAVFVWGWYG